MAKKLIYKIVVGSAALNLRRFFLWTQTIVRKDDKELLTINDAS